MTAVTIDVRIRTRAEMNTATPRPGNWTYHHVQPVRIYYMAASTILRFITDETCYDATRVLATNALCKMCNNGPNQASVRTFVSQNQGVPTADSDRALIAKLLASPPFGGFAGVNPAQRSDDPHDGPETQRPHSANAGWWDAVTQIGSETLGAYGLLMMPAPNTFLAATKQDHEWNEVVLALVGYIEQAALNGLHAFDRKDWKVSAGGNWTLPAPADHALFPPHAGHPAYPPMALRLRSETYTYLDPASIPAAALVRRGALGLRVRGGSDYLDYI